MPGLSRHPQVIKLAKDLGLSTRGDCLAHIDAYALATAEAVILDAPVTVDSLELLRRMLLDKFRVRLEFIREDGDVARLAERFADFHTGLSLRLEQEFLVDSTEGITLEREEWDPRRFQYLAVVDARGARAARAYFTAWHEITHLVVHPAQLKFPGFRRSPGRTDVAKDPLESVVDHVAGHLAFLPRFFAPILHSAVSQTGGEFTFAAIEVARGAVDPAPSLFATAIGSLAVASMPLLLVEVELAFKKAEARALRSVQQAFDFAAPSAASKVRAVKVVPNQPAKSSNVALRPNMRIPRRSVLMQAFESSSEVDLVAIEDQGWWETSSSGFLPTLPLRVQAVRRGRYVYGLIEAVS